MEKKLQKIYLRYQNLLIGQDLWEAHYQILSIIFLKEFTKIKCKYGLNDKNEKLVELHAKYASAFLNTQTLRKI